MSKIAFISICDRNAHGLRMMLSSLGRNGHECHTVFLKRYGRSPSVEAEPDDYPWIGIDSTSCKHHRFLSENCWKKHM